MIVRRMSVCAAILAGFAAIGGCSSDSEVSVDAVRQAADGAQSATCPVNFDVPAALRSGGVDKPAGLDSAKAEVSKTDEPAADPLAAQQQGMSPLDAAAGAYIECEYRVGEDALTIRLVATRVKAATAMLAPQIARDAGLTLKDLQGFITSPPGPGEIKVAGGSVALGGLAVDDGGATLMVSSTVPDVHDDTLRTVAGTLLSQVSF